VRGVLAGYSRRPQARPVPSAADCGRACGLYGRHGRDCGPDAVTERTLQVCPDEDVRPTGANSRPSQSYSFPLSSPGQVLRGSPPFETRTRKGEPHEPSSSEIPRELFAAVASGNDLHASAGRSCFRPAREFSVGERSQRVDDSLYQHDRARTLARGDRRLRTHFRL